MSVIRIQERLVDKTLNDVNLWLYLAGLSLGYNDTPYIAGGIMYFWSDGNGYVYPNDFAYAADIYGRKYPLGYTITWKGKLLTLVCEYDKFAYAEYNQLEAMETLGMKIESVPTHKYLISSVW